MRHVKRMKIDHCNEYMEIVEPLDTVGEMKFHDSTDYEERTIPREERETLNVLSLFSGCGGMDLGFEGGFPVLRASVNEALTPHFIERGINKKKLGDKKQDNGFVQLRKTRFKTVFANDILKGARDAWVSYFSKRGHKIGRASCR